MSTSYGKLIALDIPLSVKTTPEGPSLRDSNGQRVAECYLESQAMEIRIAVNSFRTHEKELAALKLREKALVEACLLALELIRNHFPLEHGDPKIAATWDALESAIKK